MTTMKMERRKREKLGRNLNDDEFKGKECV